MTTPNPPIALVSVTMLRPFVEQVEKRGGDHEKLLAQVGLSFADLQDGYQPSRKLWEYIELAARDLEDRQFGFGIGRNTPIEHLQNLKSAQPGFPTLGESLAKLIVDSKRLTNQATYTLSHDAETAVFRQRRLFRPISAPVQSEGFLVGLLIRVIQASIGTTWERSMVRAHLIDGSVVPDTVLSKSSKVEGNREGVHVEFPAEWLLIGNGGRDNRNLESSFFDDFDWLKTLRAEIEKRLSDPNLRLADVSGVFSLAERTMQQALQNRGTSFQEEVARCRLCRSKKLLLETDLPVGAIAEKVGLPSIPSFSRAFRHWTGEPPRAYRKRHK